MGFLKKLFGSTTDSSSEVVKNHLPEIDLETLPTDELFMHHFKKNGGKFLYCENLNETREQFENILEENDWFECEALCFEPKLYSLLEENKLNFEDVKNPKFIFASCENLIADEGAILFSSNQIRQYKPNELPTNIVILATTSQISMSKGDSLQKIRKKYTSDYPTNITAIKYFDQSIEQDFLSYGSVPKNLYLLLLEDL